MQVWPRTLGAMFFLLAFLGAAWAQDGALDDAVTPPRLSYLDGDVSFWRPGADDWSEAWLNTPIASGDVLYVGDRASLELQVGSREFIRADERTQIALVNHEPGFLQFQVTTGRVSLDLRELPAGQTIEVDTPNAVFTIAQSGYYRVDVDQDTHFITRLGGRATVIPAGGRPLSVFPAEEIVVFGTDVARVEAYVAPAPDHWDRWNYARSDDLVDAVSARYLPPGVYGANELDHYGSWRVVHRYGPVWVPDGVPRGWVPYSTGRWIWDPYYEWTWVDDAPWGWAPFHYGRWIHIDGVWAWVPGPAVVRPVVYSPALVVFFRAGRDLSVRIGIGPCGLAWVALGWGEPLLPWWGRPAFRGRPWWGGWGGPRVVNNVVIKQTTVVNVTKIVYQNTRVARTVVVSPDERFGRRRVEARSMDAAELRHLEPVRGELPVKPGPDSMAAGAPGKVRPSREVFSRPVVSTRAPRESRPKRAETLPGSVEVAPKQKPEALPEPRYVEPPKARVTVLPRPEFGTRSDKERQRPPQPPRYRDMREPAVQPETVRKQQVTPSRSQREPVILPRQPTSSRREEPRAPRATSGQAQQVAPSRSVSPRPAPSAAEAPRQERGREQPAERQRALPGKPANRVFRKEKKGDVDE